MCAILLLSVAMAGQSAAVPPVVPAGEAQRYAIRIYKTRYEGMTFYVRGYYRPDIRRIIWNKDDEFNIESYAIAIVTQATFGDEQEETPPLARKPLIASRPIYVRPPLVAGSPNPKR